MMDDKFNDGILIGDLACLSKFSFMSIYGCSAKKYDDYINYFGVDTLIVLLCRWIKEITSNHIYCPDNLKREVLQIYKMRIVQLKLYNYEKDNFIFSYIGDA